MRYAVISDIHSNRHALKAVLTDIRSLKIDEIICLGDIVGYGPTPKEVFEAAYNNIHHFLLGNHDAVIAGIMDPGCFNDNARRLIEWTGSVLDGATGKFFRTLPLVIEGSCFRCTHGEFADPGRFGYIIDQDEAAEAFRVCSEQLLFAGHSHLPGIFVIGQSGTPHQLPPQDFSLEDGKRYIVNVGSVGQPRDNDIRASYCIFDITNKNILFRKIPFDIEAYCEDLRRSRIPEETSYFVGRFRNQPVKPIRDILDFGRLDAKDAVKTAKDVEKLEKTVKSLRKTRAVLLASLAVILALAVAAMLGLFKSRKEAAKALQDSANAKSELNEAKEEIKKYAKFSYGPKIQKPVPSSEIIPEKEILSEPEGEGEIGEAYLLKDWTVILTDPKVQKVIVESPEGKADGSDKIFRIQSSSPSAIKIEFKPVQVEKGMRFRIFAQFKSVRMESGFAGIFLEQELSPGARTIVAQKIPDNLKNSSKWTGKNNSDTMSKDDAIKEPGKVFFVIRAEFKGEILVRKCSLTLKKD